MVCRSKAVALLCAIAPPNVDCIGVWAGFFCCRLCSLIALCPWKGYDVDDTLEPSNTTPGRLADLDLLEVGFLTKWRGRLWVLLCVLAGLHLGAGSLHPCY